MLNFIKTLQLGSAKQQGQGHSVAVWGDIQGEINNQADLQNALDNKLNKDSTYNKAELDAKLLNKADKATSYTKTEVDDLLEGKAEKSSTYTKTETDNLLNQKVNNTELSSYYTKTQTDSLLSGKVDNNTLDNYYVKSNVYNKTETDGLLGNKADKTTTYTKTESDSLLNNKANKDLGNVNSFSGSFEDKLWELIGMRQTDNFDVSHGSNEIEVFLDRDRTTMIHITGLKGQNLTNAVVLQIGNGSNYYTQNYKYNILKRDSDSANINILNNNSSTEFLISDILDDVRPASLFIKVTPTIDDVVYIHSTFSLLLERDQIFYRLESSGCLADSYVIVEKMKIFLHNNVSFAEAKVKVFKIYEY